MPYGDPDPHDPNMLVGVSVPVDREAVREMAYAFVEEYAALGYDEKRLLALFRQPFYAGPHRAYRILGEEETRSIISEGAQCWGRVRMIVSEPAAAAADGSLVPIGDLGGGHHESTLTGEEGD